MSATSEPLASSTRRMWVWANSLRNSATRSPTAHSRPGEGGTMTGNEPISWATAFACSGPAPPKATSAKSRGSWPRCTETRRRAPAMFSLTMATMPSAASSTDRPMASPIGLHRGAGGLDVERHLAAEQARRQVAEHDVRVGHGRVGAALAVGRRAGLGAGRLRADAQRAGELRDVGDRAAAGADGVHVDRRHLDPEVADRGVADDRRLAVLAQRDVRGRAAHVERQDVLVAGAAGDVERAGDAARRAREDAVDRVAGRLRRRHQAGVGAQDVHVGVRADALQAVLELAHVRRHLRPHVRVHAGRQRALVLAELGHDVGAAA